MDLPKYAYFQGQIVAYEQAKVGVLTHALNYGTAAFSGLRAYWNEKRAQLYLFRPEDHYLRFLNSAKLLLMEFDHTILEGWTRAIHRIGLFNYTMGSNS